MRLCAESEVVTAERKRELAGEKAGIALRGLVVSVVFFALCVCCNFFQVVVTDCVAWTAAAFNLLVNASCCQ